MRPTRSLKIFFRHCASEHPTDRALRGGKFARVDVRGVQDEIDLPLWGRLSVHDILTTPSERAAE